MLERRRRIHRGGAEVAEKGEWKVTSVNSDLRFPSSFDLPQDDPEQCQRGQDGEVTLRWPQGREPSRTVEPRLCSEESLTVISEDLRKYSYAKRYLARPRFRTLPVPAVR